MLFVNAPEGFEYRPELISAPEERALIASVEALEFAAVEMRGVVARRRTAHFGWSYGFERRTTSPGSPIPDFLLPLRHVVAEWAGIDAEQLAEALVTEYQAGAPIGWHRDAPMFGDVVGVSLLSACRMKFRPYLSPKDIVAGAPPRRTTHQVELAPRSAYLIRGLARTGYEHHIPAVASLRYSVTFRTLRRPPPVLTTDS